MEPELMRNSSHVLTSRMRANPRHEIIPRKTDASLCGLASKVENLSHRHLTNKQSTRRNHLPGHARVSKWIHEMAIRLDRDRKSRTTKIENRVHAWRPPSPTTIGSGQLAPALTHVPLEETRNRRSRSGRNVLGEHAGHSDCPRMKPQYRIHYRLKLAFSEHVNWTLTR